tara:strand:- start:172 stop:498 length:327 start_codon:yes stop_codon:yes gene_type:complete
LLVAVVVLVAALLEEMVVAAAEPLVVLEHQDHQAVRVVLRVPVVLVLTHLLLNQELVLNYKGVMVVVAVAVDIMVVVVVVTLVQLLLVEAVDLDTLVDIQMYQSHLEV